MRSMTLALLALSSVSWAQFHAVVGPPVAPIGCPFVIGVSNDTSVPQWVSACPFIIKDATGATVAPGGCPGIVYQLNPGQTYTTGWPQFDFFGNPLAPGMYSVEVNLLGTTFVQNVLVGGVDAAIAHQGVPKIGTNRNLELCSPLDAGHAYLAGAALSSTGIPTCNGVVPLALDPLLLFSIDPTNPVFLNFAGTLDAGGMSQAPSLALPNLPGIVGASFVVSYIVVDPSSPCIVRRIAAPLVVTIV
jgi:hypothetical protein